MGQFNAFMAVLAVIFIAVVLGFVAMAKYKPTPRQMLPWMMGLMVSSLVAVGLVLRLPVAVTVFFGVLMAVAAVVGSEMGHHIDQIVQRRNQAGSTSEASDLESENSGSANSNIPHR